MIRGTFDIPLGTLEILIDIPGDISFDAEIERIGTLDLNIDLTPDGVAIDRIVSLFERIRTQWFQYSDNGRDLYDTLITAQLAQSRIPVTLRITKYDGEVYDFPLVLNQGNVSVDEASNIVGVTFEAFYDDSATVAQVFDAIESDNDMQALIRGGQNLPACGSKTFVQKALLPIFGNSFTSIVAPNSSAIVDNGNEFLGSKLGFLMARVDQDAIFEPTPDPNPVIGASRIVFFNNSPFVDGSERLSDFPPQPGKTRFLEQVQPDDVIRDLRAGGIIGTVKQVISDVSLELYSNANFSVPIFGGDPVRQNYSIERGQKIEDEPVIEVIKTLAAGDGAFFGSAFSRNFFIGRLEESVFQEVVIGLDELESLSIDKRFPYLNTTFITSLSDNTIDGVENFGNIKPKLAFDGFKFPNLTRVGVKSIRNESAEKDLVISVGVGYPFLNKGIWNGTEWNGEYDGNETDNAIETDLVLGASKSYIKALTEGDLIRFTVFSADKVKPWSVITFDESVPERYQDRKFRVTSAKYNFVEDKIEVEAYEIKAVVGDFFRQILPGQDALSPDQNRDVQQAINNAILIISNDFLAKNADLSDLQNTASARGHLDVYSTGEVDAIETALSADIDTVEADSKARDASLSLSLDFLSKTKAEAGTKITLDTSGGLEGGSVITLTDDATLNVNIADSGVTNAKLANSTISGKELGTNLDSLSAGDGLTGTAYNGSTARSFSADVVEPIAIQSGKIGLSQNEPLFTNGTALDIRDHASNTRGVLLSTPQSIFGDKTFEAQSRLANNAKMNSSAGYASGFTGSGFQLAREGTLWRLELDDMFIRGALFASELIINQISAVNGSEIMSAGRGKVEEYVGRLSIGDSDVINAGTYTVIDVFFPTDDFTLLDGTVLTIAGQTFIVDGQQSIVSGVNTQIAILSKVITVSIPSFTEIFQADYATVSDPTGGNFASFADGDIVTVQRFQPNNNAVIKRIVREVVLVESDRVYFIRTAGAPSDVGDISEGDILVSLGNTKNANRQSSIFRSVVDSGAPFVRINDGVNSFASFGELSKLKLQYGNLEGLSSLGVSGHGFYSANAFLTGQLTVGDLTKAGNYLEYNGTNLKVVANEVFIGATNLATELDDLSESFFNLQSDIVQLSLANGFQQSGLTLLAGQAVLKAFDVTEDGRGRLAQIDLDATVDSGSQIRLFADDIMLDANTSIEAKVGTIDGEISALELTQNTFDLFTSSSSAIGNTNDDLEGTITQVPVLPTISATVYAGTVLTIGGQTFTVTDNTNIVSGEGINIDVTSKAVVNTLQAGLIVNATGAYVGVSGQVSEQGSELVLKVQSGTGKIASVALGADASGGDSNITIRADRFQTITPGMEIDTNAQNPFIKIGTDGFLEGHNWRIDEDIWVHPTLGAILFARNTVATFAQGGSAASITDSSFETNILAEASTPPEGITAKQPKIRVQYLHKFGINKIVISGQFRRVVEKSSGDDIATGQAIVTSTVFVSNPASPEVSGTASTSGESFTGFTTALDVSSLTANTRYVIQVELTSQLFATLSEAETAQTQAYLREDVVIISEVSL